jgi:polysaccharide pyruvyl transferase WcaK-like protein
MAADVHIGIITRLVNTNAGNEALSTELIKLAAELTPGARVMAVNRYPRYFEHLKIAALSKPGSSPPAEFDKLALRLSHRFFRKELPLPAAADSTSVVLNPTARELAPSVRRIKNFVGFRRNLARFGLIERDEAFSTVSLCGRVNLLIWNPAGEFHPTGNRDQTFRLLLLIRIAQQLGVATAIVNHSLEISDGLLREIVGHVYRHASHICVRDAKSAQVVLSLGVNPKNLSESPDLVFLASRDATPAPPGSEPIPDGCIGLAINATEAMRGIDEWDSLLTQLKRFGRPLVFVSNAMNGDLAFGSRLMSRYGGTTIARQPSYRELRDLYRKMSVVISSRLHASILSLCAGAPVVTLEPSVFKLSAIMQQLNYPIATDKLTSPGWSDRVSRNVELALARREWLVNSANGALARQTTNIFRAYEPIFGLAGSRMQPT